MPTLYPPTRLLGRRAASVWAGAALLACLAAGAPAPTPALAQTGAGGAAAASLEDRLKLGLRVYRPEDVEFVRRVVQKVEAGALPLDLVMSTFQWARKLKRPYPYVYFERVLRDRAAQRGVAL